MKTFRAVIYSILSLALSGFCFYKIYTSRNVVSSIKIDITDNMIITRIIDSALKFADGKQAVVVMILGIAAMILYTITAFPLHEFFSNLPLGSIKKIDYFKLPKTRFILFSSFCPALVIGLYTAIHILLQHLISEKRIEIDVLNAFVKWGLPLTILLTLIIFIALTINIIRDGGLWGVLIRLPLLLTENVCLSIVMGALLVSVAFLMTVGMINLVFLLLVLVAILIYPLIHKIKT